MAPSVIAAIKKNYKFAIFFVHFCGLRPYDTIIYSHFFYFFIFSVPAGALTLQPVRDKFPSAALIIQDETFNL